MLKSVSMDPTSLDSASENEAIRTKGPSSSICSWSSSAESLSLDSDGPESSDEEIFLLDEELSSVERMKPFSQVEKRTGNLDELFDSDDEPDEILGNFRWSPTTASMKLEHLKVLRHSQPVPIPVRRPLHRPMRDLAK
eukprot:CAMPEP_0196656124 /NCGR_PEP_ID=MMETSP1086-20130531/13606_1 /TAXON_ID=77921 /ORGANISM="Cyanoptyche  gloeocystis , Strain SAG4.97" /LENGTH=137 /DNA_ID=CAMNT_0041988745 /DNA_START=220 /DNA_END=633 /DNA_ORIENTATION=+